MFFVYGLIGKPKADQRNDGRTCVRNVVKSVRNNRDRRGNDAEHQLSDKQQKIGKNTANACQRSVFAAYGRFGNVFIFTDKNANEKIRHKSPLFINGIPLLYADKQILSIKKNKSGKYP